MQCVILAGGLGTRMKPWTDRVPKALLPVCGRPFADYQLQWLSKEGVSDVVYCIGHMGSMIRAFVGRGRQWGLSVRYADEGEALRGTGGALRLAYGILDRHFFVLYGDSFLPIKFGPVWRCMQQSRRKALMTILRNNNDWDASNVICESGKILLYDKGAGPELRKKMTHIDYGLSLFSRDVVKEMIPSTGFSDLAALQHRLSVLGELEGFEVSTRFYQIGSPDGLEDFRRYIEKTGFGASEPSSASAGSPSVVGANAAGNGRLFRR